MSTMTKQIHGPWAVHEAHDYGNGKLYRANGWGRWALTHTASGLLAALFHRLDEAKAAARRCAAIAPQISHEEFAALNQTAKLALGCAAQGKSMDCAVVHHLLVQSQRNPKFGGVLCVDAVRRFYGEDGGDIALLTL